jgi:hypothetical protein
MPILEQTCQICNHINSFRVSYIDPNLYTNPETASVSRASWCIKCGTLIGAKYKCIAEDTVELLDSFLPTPKSVPDNKPYVKDEDAFGNNEDDYDPTLSQIDEDFLKPTKE